MKVGSICYSCHCGLGMLAKSFYDAGVVTDTFVVEHPHYETDHSWFPHSPMTRLRSPDMGAVEKWVSNLDLLLAFETPYFWNLLPFCRQRGIKTVCIPMYEWWPAKPPAQFDFYLCPSLLDLQVFHSIGPAEYLPIPVDPSKWKQRDRAIHFLHNAGRLGSRNHKGSDLLFQAIPDIKSPCKITIRSQTNRITQLMRAYPRSVEDPRVQVLIGDVPYHTLFEDGDVYIAIERYNGLSLPLQEAFAAGMPVITSDRYPHNTWLPRNLLVPVSHYDRVRVSPGYMEIDEAIVHPKDIAAKIDSLFDTDVSAYSFMGKAWAEENSWEKLKPKYLNLLESL